MMPTNALVVVESPDRLGGALKKFIELHGQECGPALRRHAHYIGPAERRRLKAKKARKRVLREAARAERRARKAAQR